MWDEGLRVVNHCQWERRVSALIPPAFDGTCRGSPGQLCASSRGKTEGASVARNYWAERACRRDGKSVVKSFGSTEERRSILLFLRVAEETGIPGVAVKCVEIGRNTGGEGGSLGNS